METKGLPAYVVNPLPETLRHYASTLFRLLEEAGVETNVIPTPSVEIGVESRSRVLVAFSSAASRLRLLGRPRGVVIGIWPALGLFECLLYLPATLRHEVLVIVHDPIPIRRQFGFSRSAAIVAKVCTLVSPRLTLVTHTELAKEDLYRSTGCSSLRLPHPLATIEPGQHESASDGSAVVRVLGQYKPTRDLGSLSRIARATGPNVRLEILGRGWPTVDGWSVVDKFLDEDEFDHSIRTATCVIIPYARFYQSGVAARCAETAVPIVGPAHEHLEELFGHQWPGLVKDGNDWATAVNAVLDTDKTNLATTMSQRRAYLHSQWSNALSALGGG